MNYINIVAAVVRALSNDNMGGGMSFEPRVQDTKLKGEITGKDDQLLHDSMIRARLHNVLAAEHWEILKAKFSPDLEHKREAIRVVRARVKSAAPARFRDAAVLTWAMPKLPGQEGKRSFATLPAEWYDMDRWSDEPVHVRTQQRWRRAIYEGLETEVNKALAIAQEALEPLGVIGSRAA